MRSYRVIIITPAVIRPSILSITYSSFYNLLFYDCSKSEVGLYINIDEVGETDIYSYEDILRVAEKYFNIIISQYSGFRNSLSTAFFKLWSMAAGSECDYFFYLEDDWELIKRINIENMISVMDKNEKLALLRIPYNATNDYCTYSWKTPYYWQEEVGEEQGWYLCDDKRKGEIGWCGHPSLVRREFIIDTLQYLSPKVCPELQMKGNNKIGNPFMSTIIKRWDYGLWGSIHGSKPMVRDIGRSWRSKRNIKKDRVSTNWIMEKK